MNDADAVPKCAPSPAETELSESASCPQAPDQAEHKLARGDPERPGEVMVVGRVVHSPPVAEKAAEAAEAGDPNQTVMAVPARL